MESDMSFGPVKLGPGKLIEFDEHFGSRRKQLENEGERPTATVAVDESRGEHFSG
ncbi:MAG: hypothetical protein ABJQ90_16300 [Parasphingorhabdus sp.]